MQLKHLLLATIASLASAAAVSRRDLPAYEKTYGILNPAVHALHQAVDAITPDNAASQAQMVKQRAHRLNAIAIDQAARIKASPQLRDTAQTNAALSKSRASLAAFEATLKAMIKKRPVIVAAGQEATILDAIKDSRSGIYALFEATISQIPPPLAKTLERLGKPLSSKAELQRQVDDMFEAVTKAYPGTSKLGVTGIPRINESGITIT
jgi:hypothetical protein